MKKVAGIIIISFLLISSVFAQKDSKANEVKPIDISWIDGTWRGIGYQIDGATWDVLFTKDEKGELSISYPTLSCVGVWKIVSTEENRIVLKEEITTVGSTCDQGTIVILNKVTPKHIAVSYFLPTDQERVIAYSTLTKQ